MTSKSKVWLPPIVKELKTTETNAGTDTGGYETCTGRPGAVLKEGGGQQCIPQNRGNNPYIFGSQFVGLGALDS